MDEHPAGVGPAEEMGRKLLAQCDALLEQWQRDALVHGSGFLHLKMTETGGFEIQTVDPRRIEIKEDAGENLPE